MDGASPKLMLLRPRARSGERPEGRLLGIEEAMSLHLDTLYRTARVLTGEHAAAEDLVQETAIRACRGWDGLRSIPSVRAWLLRILHRTFLNSRRSEGRRPQLVDLDLEELVTHPLVGLEFEPTSIRAVLSDELTGALEALPSGFREALWLVDVEELKLVEAAEVLEVPLGTVASRVHRARRLVRERLERGGSR